MDHKDARHLRLYVLAALFFAAGGAHLLGKFSRRREELVQKLLKLKR